MPTIREILVGYQAVNEREREDMRQRLSRLTVDESLRQYLRLRALARRVAPGLERVFVEQRKAYYVQAHHVPYMVIGGIADAVWGQPRYTHDVDLKIALGEVSIIGSTSLPRRSSDRR